jgi:hypothetical protein
LRSQQELLRQLLIDHDRFCHGLPDALEEYILNTYRIDLSSTYGGHKIRNPFGKASGQLSLNHQQVQHDVDAGLGFVVLKTVIAEGETGEQSMKAWAIPASRMKVERIEARRPDASEKEGWTVTWKGRGWSGSLQEYLDFFDRVIVAASKRDVLIVPSCNYHLLQEGESLWQASEYAFTTRKLLNVWFRHRNDPMPIEKDFSPTLAGDAHFSSIEVTIQNWIREVPQLIRNHVGFNAQFDDDFQIEMLRECDEGEDPADYLIYGNRLFDPNKEFEGKTGVAYGGPDLSARNLSVLSQYRPRLPFSATGDILTGKQAFEYLKRGATSFQMHTLFQLPDGAFAMTAGTRSARALHRLLFHPEHGFIRAILSLDDLSPEKEHSIPSLIGHFMD